MLSHVDKDNRPTMVNVSQKAFTHRTATAISLLRVPRVILDQLEAKNANQQQEIYTKKGPVFATAIVSGTMAVKKCSELIPFCHSIPIEGCNIQIHFNSKMEILITCTVDTHYKTGVEMEALTGASIAALTIYDMCKALSQDMEIISTRLLEKKGGKSDHQFPLG